METVCRDLKITYTYEHPKTKKPIVEKSFYFLGFLHDFGMVILDQVFYRFYRYTAMNDTSHFAIYEKEKNLPFNHALIGANALIQANLSRDFATIISKHHTPDKANEKQKQLCSLLYLAEFYFAPTFSGESELGLEEGDARIVEKLQKELGLTSTDIQKYISSANREFQTELHGVKQ